MSRLMTTNQRLARRAAWFALIPVLCMCSADSLTSRAPGIESPTDEIESVTVSPGNASAEVGLAMQFAAKIKDHGGNTVADETVVWSSSDPGVVSVSSTGMATGLSVGSATITATARGKKGNANVKVTPGQSQQPGTVMNLSVTSVTSSSATLSFTQVDDGTGNAASYEVRYALSPMTWSSAASASNGSCAAPIAGTAIGAGLTCTILGLSPGTSYNFQVIAFRGTMNAGAVFGPLSNLSAATTPTTSAPPPPPVVTSVSVSPSSASLQVGTTIALVATVRDQSGNVMTGLPVSWSSTNASIASVNANGTASAVAAGSTSIRATVSGVIGTTTITVTAAPPPPPPAPSPVVTTVTIAPSTASIAVAATQALTATVKDQNGSPMTGQSVTWSSGNTAVATVNASGVVTGVAAGTATITGTSASKSGTATITVTAPAPPPPTPVATTVTVSPGSASISAAGTQLLTATVKDQNGNTMAGQTVTWSTSSSGVATVSAGGVVTGVGAGTATITAASSGKTGTATITVTAPVPVATTVTVAPSTASVVVGATVSLAATVKDQNGNTMAGQMVTWSTSASNRATVNSSGVVSGVSAGTATITATSSGKTGTATITVTAPAPVVTTVTLAPAAASIAVGATQALTATVKDQNGNTMSGQTVTWTSSSTAIATVSNAGVVTGVAAGTATITGTSAGKSGTSTITVTAAPPPPPPPPPGSGTLLFSEGFENASVASRGWYDNTNPAISTTEHVAGSAASLQFHWTQGARSPIQGGSLRKKFTASDGFYMSYSVKYSANYVGSGQAYHPHEFHAMSNLDDDWGGPADAYMTVYVEQNYQNGGIPKLFVQDNKSINTSMGSLPRNLVGVTENRSVSGCNGMVETGMMPDCFTFSTTSGWYNAKGLAGPMAFSPNPSSPGYKANWNFVEAYFQMNTVVNGVGQANGVMQYWFNGQLLIDRHDVLFRTGAHPNLQFDKFLMAPYIGDGSPVDQYMWIDNLRVATGRIP